MLDVNNVFVSCTNHGTDPRAWLAALPLHFVDKIHLGGHDAEDLPSGPLLIDSHGTPVGRVGTRGFCTGDYGLFTIFREAFQKTETAWHLLAMRPSPTRPDR